MTDTPYFVIDDLTIGYHKVPVIRDISVKVQKGEIIALIGPNGAGKSTLLKTIARDLEPIRGKIFLEGRDMQTITYRELSKKLAVILTERIKVELTTCRDVVATGRYPYTGRLGVLRGEDQRIVDEAMETVHALELAERDFNAISDGQRQRVLLARAIAQQPEMILLDEPTSFLDVRHKLDLLTILTRMARKKNITVIMSLHEIDLAEKVADRILTVKGDTHFGFGAPGEVFEEQVIRKLSTQPLMASHIRKKLCILHNFFCHCFAAFLKTSDFLFFLFCRIVKVNIILMWAEASLFYKFRYRDLLIDLSTHIHVPRPHSRCGIIWRCCCQRYDFEVIHLFFEFF